MFYSSGPDLKFGVAYIGKYYLCQSPDWIKEGKSGGAGCGAGWTAWYAEKEDGNAIGYGLKYGSTFIKTPSCLDRPQESRTIGM
jgi:hypothetical protein